FDRRTYAECRSVRELRPAFPRLTQPPTSARWLAGPAFLGAGKFPSEHRCPLPRSPQFRTTQHRGGVSPRSPDPVASVNRPLRCRLAQPAVFVNERNRNAVHFWLDYHRDLFVRQKPLDTGVKIFHFLFRVSVIETEHWDQMRNLLERFKRFSADSLSG